MSVIGKVKSIASKLSIKSFGLRPPIQSKWLPWWRVGSVATAVLLNTLLGYYCYRNYQMWVDQTNIATLNQKVSAYQEKVGTLPDLNLVDLYHQGLTDVRIHRTPFGGYYRLDPNQPVVYNPNLVSK